MATFYEDLGVSETATPAEIKTAYRKLANKHHPDKGGDTAEFQKIQRAYETLSDKAKREQYDNRNDQLHNAHDFFASGNFDDILSKFGFHPGGFNRTPQNRMINVQVQITLEEAFHGKDLEATITLPSGKEQSIKAKIPAGVQSGQTISMPGLGDDSVQNVPRGDLRLTIVVLQHTVFQPHGVDLFMEVPVPAIDAIIGGDITFTTIDNQTVTIGIKPGLQVGQMISVAGYGMPNPRASNGRGNLILSPKIIIPTGLNAKQQELLAEVRTLFPK